MNSPQKRTSVDNINLNSSKKRKVYVEISRLLIKPTPTTSIAASAQATPVNVGTPLRDVTVERNRSLSLDSTVTSESSSGGSPGHPNLSAQGGGTYSENLESPSPHRKWFNAVEITPYSHKVVPTYRPGSDEVLEMAAVRIPGESLESATSLDNVPVRFLSNFVLYDSRKRLISFEQVVVALLSASKSEAIFGSGFGTSCSTDGQPLPPTTDASVRLALSEVIDYWTDYTTRDLVGLWQIRTIAIKTDFAWYILGSPADIYAASYQPFWVAHFVTWRGVHAMRQRSDISRQEFFTYLKKTNDPDFLDVMGREITEYDLSQPFVASYLLEQLNVKSAILKSMRQLSLVQDFVHTELAEQCVNRTVVSPLVFSIARRIFHPLLFVDGECHPSSLPPAVRNPPILHPNNPLDVSLGDLILDHPTGDLVYSSISIDGVVYEIGDCIMVKPGVDELPHRAFNAVQRHSLSRYNDMGDRVWFCKIRYIFDSSSSERSEPLLHVQWFEHSSKTILQELAHPLELFGIYECDDIAVGAVLGLVDVLHPDSINLSPNGYYCRFTWDNVNSSFLEYPHSTPLMSHCDSCDHTYKREHSKSDPVEISNQKIATRNGTEYHINDFIYLSESTSKLYIVGQLLKFSQSDRTGKWRALILLFGRFDDVACTEGNAEQPCDERRLFQTEEKIWVSFSEIGEKCWVANYDEVEDEHGFETFYVDQCAPTRKCSKLSDLKPLKEKIQRCSICLVQTRQARDESRAYRRDHVPLRMMELFAGAGGLSTGLEQTGFMKSYWAVELSPSAAATFQANHHDSIVYNEDTSVCLQSALNEAAGKRGQRLKTVKDGKRLMPQPGEVDLIAGGFPCQSFSGMNHQRQKSDDDIRTTLVANMLSYVDFYRPRFVLMENVKGLLQHHSKTSHLEPDENIADTVEEVKMSIVKFILRTLLQLGYQVRFRVLEAADYGSPQRRERVIFMAARCGETLPSFPLPTHATESHRGQSLTLPTGDKLYPVERDPNQHAPFRALTVADAIGDLPKFGWIHPGCAYGKDLEHTLLESDCKEFSAVSAANHTLVGFPAPVAYRTEPLTRYQQNLRTSEQKVTLHCSRTFQTAIVERVWHICSHEHPKPTDLPQQFWTPALRSSIQNNSQRTWKTRFACRLQWNKAFNTALTTCRPFSKGTSALHPTQKRIITTRECARSQGFPDDYHFVQEADCRDWPRLLDDIHKQIGNAVPVPLARALGYSLRAALLEKWRSNHA